MLEKIAQRLLLILQFVLVFIFILFEEIIWEGIAKPIYEKLSELKILKRFELLIHSSNRYIVLFFFLLLLLGVEGAGLMAGVFFVQGYILFGLLLYIAKIPIAAFVFWLFKVSKDKLLSFGWFEWSFNKLMAGLSWLKKREIYKRSMAKVALIKEKIKAFIQTIKEKFFTKESRFSQELKSFYSYMKNFKNRKKKND